MKTSTFIAGVAALFLATGTAQAQTCDTEHTSDKRGQWRCHNLCIYRFSSGIQLDFDHQMPSTQSLALKISGRNATLNGKPCKYLEQTPNQPSR
jgi:hypothetical protein